MKGNDRDPSARRKEPFSCRESFPQRLQLVVDRDPYCLKRSFCRVLLFPKGFRRHRAPYNFRKLQRGSDRTVRNDFCCNLWRVPFLAVFIQNPFDLRVVPFVYDIRCRQRGTACPCAYRAARRSYRKIRGCASSNCGEDTPRSIKIPSMFDIFLRANSIAISRKSLLISVTAPLKRASRISAASIAS